MLVIQKEEKKCPEKAEGEIISFSQPDMSVRPHLCHITWQKRCPHSWHICPCKQSWRNFEEAAPKVLKHKINHRAWISTNWKVTMVARPGCLFFFFFWMCYICIHACAGTSVSLKTLKITVFVLFKYFLTICFPLKIAVLCTRHRLLQLSAKPKQSTNRRHTQESMRYFDSNPSVQLPSETSHFLWASLNFILLF